MLRIIIIKSDKNLLLDMAENTGVKSGISSLTKSAKNSLVLRNWLKMLRLVAIIIIVMINRLKDHLFQESKHIYRVFFPLYTLKKGKVCKYNKLNSHRVHGT